MAGDGVTLKVLNPRAQIGAVPTVSASPRLGDLTGKKIAIIRNGKSGGDMLLPYVEEALKRQIARVQTRTWLVPVAQREDLREPVLKEIAADCDGVVALIGD